jgi:chorismate-pyruvate lyase
MTYPVAPDLETLVELFYPSREELGHFQQVPAEGLPADYRELLAHESHMTVTVEAFHQCSVDVRVLAKKIVGPLYARKITLVRHGDGRVVQYGIMRINFRFLEADVIQQIEREGTPLGRVLIEHNVLRRVHLAHLWQVTPGPDLQAIFGLAQSRLTFGRTATIECNGEPAVELLEIVAPLPVPPLS